MKYDYNLIVIGAGAGGLVSAYLASASKAKVALIEKHNMGGDCLNTGCVPSKALIGAAHLAHLAKMSKDFGFHYMNFEFDFKAIMAKVHETIQAIEPHDSIERYTQLGVKCIQGHAQIQTNHSVKVNGQILTTQAIIIATGSKPHVPDIEGLEDIDYLTSDSLWNLKTLPQRFLILGGGAIACEMAQAFSRLGSEVSMLYRKPHLMSQEDVDVATQIEKRFQKEGITLLNEHCIVKFTKEDHTNICIAKHQDQIVSIPFDQVLFALGRKIDVKGLGLEALGVKLTDDAIASNHFLQTNIPSIYVCGDAAGSPRFTHAALHEAWHASMNALFSPFKKFRCDHSIMPYCIFTHPQVARVGLNEQSAKAQGIAYEVSQFDLSDLDRAIIERVNEGVIKVLTPIGKDQILGVAIVGEHAAEILPEFVLAMKHHLGLSQILATPHLYPSFAEANKFVAGVWKKKHLPKWIFKCAEAFHSWKRKGSIF